MLVHDPTAPVSAPPAAVPGRANPFVGHLPALDGLRGVAILLVMVFHFAPIQSPTTAAGAWLAALLRVGWCGVDLFFVLSGFLITGVLLDSRGAPGYFRTFYARRTLRIFPLYYGVLLAVFVVYPLFESAPSSAYQRLAGEQGWLWTYAANWREGLAGRLCFVAGPWHLSHFWSLAVEEQFYLVWPFAVFCLRGRALPGLCAAVALGALGLRVALVCWGVDYLAAYTLTPCRLDGLAVGAFLAVTVRGPGGPALMRRAPALALASGAALLGLFAWRGGLPHDDPVVQTAGYSLLAVFFGSILLVAVAAPAGGAVGRLGRSGFLRFFGKYSYGLYVFHGLVLMVVHRWVSRAAPPNALASLLAREAAGFAASIALALLSWHLYEKHFLKLKRFFDYRKGLSRPSSRSGAREPAGSP